MLSKADIQSEVYSSSFHRGEEIFKDKKVHNLEYRMISKDKAPISEINAMVVGSSGDHVYPVTVIVDEEYDNINSYHCECDEIGRAHV